MGDDVERIAGAAGGALRCPGASPFGGAVVETRSRSRARHILSTWIGNGVDLL